MKRFEKTQMMSCQELITIESGRLRPRETKRAFQDIFGTGRWIQTAEGLAPTKGCKDKKSHSAINEVMTQEYAISIHRYIHEVGSQKRVPQTFKEIWTFTMKEMGTPDVCINTKLNKAVWAKRIKNAPYRIRAHLSRKCNEDEDSPSKLYTWVTYVPITAFKTL
ncbi:60S ribosomal protein L31-like [Sorex araneus]|uniref:60S ribosomal protein L31-like n=1 Tax=Sorex araneus TaxID=42254 RepID=UPI0024339BF9|nr:60S ribosomal protein L31-like [Sorex araneus]